jgi:hypothetical protein
MALGDLPHIAASSYTSTTHGVGALMSGNALGLSNTATGGYVDTITTDSPADWLGRAQQGRTRRMQEGKFPFGPRETTLEMLMANTPSRRLVQVLIVDPNENVPLEQCLLYKGEPKMTDATDQELFFEIDIKDILAKHNEKRVQIVDRKVKERTEHLEPAKIRDLKMVVVNIAAF